MIKEPEYVFRKDEGWVPYIGPRHLKAHEIRVGDKIIGWKNRNNKFMDTPAEPYVITKVTATKLYYKHPALTQDTTFHDIPRTPEQDSIEYFIVE